VKHISDLTSAPALTGRKIAHQTFWAATDNWTQQGGQLIAFLVIGNILGPELFGIMGMAHLFVMFMLAFLVNGFSEAIVQRQQLEEEHLDAAFWLLLGLGFLATGISYYGAELMAALFQQELLVDIVRWLSLSFLIAGANSLQQCILRRQLAFHALAVRSIVAYGGSMVIGIVLALRGYGLWSLVVYYLSQRVLETVTLSLYCRWMPRLRLSWPHLRDLISFGLNNTGFRVLGFVGQHVERLIVGFFLGATDLGIFSMARKIVNSASNGLTGVLNNVVMSVLARVQDDKERLKAIVTRATHLTSLVAFPAFGGLIVVAPELIRAMLRPEWQGLVIVLQILCFNGLWQCMTFYLFTTLRALGRADLSFRMSCVTVTVRTVAALLIVGYGLVPLAFSSVVISLVGAPVLFHLVARRVGLSSGAYLRGLAPAVLATLLMMACVAATDRLLLVPAKLSYGTQTILLISVGIVAYLLAVFVIARREIVDVWRQIRAS
jgi:PST family polysaccharide transporter